MNTLKEYVVYEGYKDIFGIKTKAAWESYLEQCDTRKIPDSERFRIITTFNADEQLQEQKGLRWVKASERLSTPWEYNTVLRAYGMRYTGAYNPIAKKYITPGGYLEVPLEDIFWLEEYTEPGQPVPAGEWISVEEELPDFNQEVLVFGKRRLTQPTMDGNPPKVLLGYRQDLTDSSIPKRDWLRYADKNNFRMMEDVTHWRPLPSPPSPKQEDKQ